MARIQLELGQLHPVISTLDAIEVKGFEMMTAFLKARAYEQLKDGKQAKIFYHQAYEALPPTLSGTDFEAVLKIKSA